MQKILKLKPTHISGGEQLEIQSDTSIKREKLRASSE